MRDFSWFPCDRLTRRWILQNTLVGLLGRKGEKLPFHGEISIIYFVLFCSVMFRKEHLGLQKQWLYVWKPRSWNEFAIVLEDDVEVSPYFYLYGKKAVEAYYLQTAETISLHTMILNHVKLRVQILKSKWNITDLGDLVELTEEQRQKVQDDEEEEDIWDFEKILKEYAGIPALYGICLQKQMISPTHFPKRFHVFTASRPYLYSIVGSWGPVMFPMIWRAFHIWWKWSIAINPQYLSEASKLFVLAKPDLWTPYFTR
jgi:hypothetical protein